MLLLEVLIAFLLIAMCLLPLLYPHTFILTSQRRFIDEVELDHKVNLQYADIVKALYRNDISWEAIMSRVEFPIDTTLPYKGSYHFGKRRRQKPNKDDASYTLYLLPLEMTFVPKKGGTPLCFHYDLFVIRDLGEGPLPQGEESDAEEGEEEE